MIFTRPDGLWMTGPSVPAGPTAAVLEVSGAVVAWTVDDPLHVPTITFTDVAAADWLWRAVGAEGHVAILTALDDGDARGAADVEVPTALESPVPLRRLAFGHWMRRWWPASARAGIVALDPVVLDGEVALLTVAAQDYFADDTLDSDVTALLRPHLSAYTALARAGDPRVGELAAACLDLAGDVGEAVEGAGAAGGLLRRDDYALAAGPNDGQRIRDPIAGGVASVDWTAVPPGVFDAADDTIDWTIEVLDAVPVATVRVAVGAPADGIAVRLRSGEFSAAGVLAVDGRAGLPLVGPDRGPVTEDRAWGHDWSVTAVSVGADVGADGTAASIRERVRSFARARLAQPGPDAFLAEVLAAESDF